tara:strand:- start:65 stop:820 length:756 start_codon:yes stop_codon:yes gene_type:complete
MNSTILLSTSRSGSTFTDKKLNGMCGHERGGEIFFEKFFIRNQIEHLINCKTEEYNKKTDVKLQNTDIYSENCFYNANQATIQEMVEKSKKSVFNIHISQIKNNLSLMKKIKTPILFLIRKNRWQRQISCYVHRRSLMSRHIVDCNTKSINVKIDKSELISRCEDEFNLLREFQKELKNQKNIKIIYYEDIQNKEYWTDKFINELEDFMKVKFTDRNFIPPLKKTRNFVNIINEAEIMDEEMIKKYYIKEI